jgi:Amt family ammonium transporter
LAVAVVAAYSFIMSYGLLKILGKIMRIRVRPEDEDRGLDESEHGEIAYGE